MANAQTGTRAPNRVTVTVAVPLEEEWVAQIRRVDPRLEVLYEPALLPPVRYPGDHRGRDGFQRSPAQEQRFAAMIERADVLFGIPGDSPTGLAAALRSSSRLGWIQATAAGAGEQVRAAGLNASELARVTVTSASGVHATPLAEFCLFGLLAFTKGLPRLMADQHAHSWSHYPTGELSGHTLLIIGLGKIGAEVARLAAAFGMRVIAINRSGTTESRDVADVHPSDQLPSVIPEADAIVVTLPLTDQTRGIIDAEAIGRMKHGAVVVNVGRGGVIDEPALVAALREGRLAGAALDVYATEPLPSDSPLWQLPNVLVSPHTAALSIRENERIVTLFAENLRRYLRGDRLISQVDPAQFY